MARGVCVADNVRRDAEVPKGVGHGQFVLDLGREFVGSLENRNRFIVVVPDDLVKSADPEQRLTFAAHVTKRFEELRRALEQRQFVGLLISVGQGGAAVGDLPSEKLRVDYPAPG